MDILVGPKNISACLSWDGWEAEVSVWRAGESPSWLLLVPAPRLLAQNKQQQMGLGDGSAG